MVRIATFNASLNRTTAGELIDDLSTATDTQAQAVAEIIQRVNPDILLINEFDYDATGYATGLFQENYLGISQNGVDPVEYPYVYFAASNTGIASGFDLDKDGNIVMIPGQSGYGNDAFGFGNFPGQYGMVLYSKLPIQFQDVRTFQFFKWQDMPDALLPVDPTTGEAWYSQAELEAFRLSSKNHWDIPIEVDGEIIHLLASHPTPPVFDGLEDRNGTRNHDEIRFWADYISPGENDYIYDDGGTFQGFAGGERFVILGDQNADPVDGDSVDGAILQLLKNTLINTSLTPSSDGGADASERQNQANDSHQGDPIYDTADFNDAPPNSGNLRVDYVLPSTNLDLVDAGIFWPTSDDPLFSLVGEGGSVTSDHRLTWIDVALDDVNTLPNGVASGDVTQTSAVLWTHSTVTGEAKFEYAINSDFSSIIGTATATATNVAQPVKVNLETLIPGTQYYYRVTDAFGTMATGEFKTANSVGTKVGLNFGVSGDWRGELSPYPAISNADGQNLEFFVELGDTIYADYSSPAVPKPQAETLLEFRAKHDEVYSDRFGLNTWADLRATTPILASIDDHEVINDFSGGVDVSTDPRFTDPAGTLINDSNLYEIGLQAFQEYNPLRDDFYGETGDSRTAGERKLYRYNTYGSDGAAIVLDNRSFRDQPLQEADLSDPNDVVRFLSESLTLDRTMLGEAQIEDLKQDLLDAQNQGIIWKFIMVPEPIQNFGPGFAADRFEGYAKERTEILKFIKENGISNVVFVAADIHGTVVNNLTYQETVGGGQIALDAFEISTGSVAFDAPFGPTVVELSAILGLLTPEQKAFYDSLPVANDADSIVNDKDDFLKQSINQGIQPFGYDPVGLNDNLDTADGLIDATLVQGDYLATQTYGWTQFSIDPETQELTVTTYGIEPYSEAELLADPSVIVGRIPTIVSQFVVTPQEDESVVPIYEIQGDGSISPILEQTLITEGIVVGDFQRSDQLQGFYIQSPDSAADDNPDTSEGLFIFDPNLTVDLQVGDRVQIAGTVKEFISTDSSLTQLADITEITILDQNNPLPTITPVTIPEAELKDWEALEGMLVTVTDADEPLTVSETFNLGRFSEVRLSADGRVIQYTNFNEPDVAGNEVYQEEVLQRTVILDDGSTRQNLYVEPLTRAGNTLESITGIVDNRFSVEYRIQPTEIPEYINSNPRTDFPVSVGGSLQIASFNVLNYFNGDGMGGGFPTSRGASSPEEFTRQRDKTISAILAIDADIVGLIELENDGYDEKSAIGDLVNGLNAKAGAQSYAFIDPGVDKLGTDEITVGFIYQVADVTPVGDAAILDKSVDPDFNTDIQRPALAQTFQEKATGEIFTPVINHFKSKGGGNEATGDDLDQGDGQGAFNATRTQAAEALTEWLATDPTQSGDPDVLILGDLNAYLQEDPITTIEEAGYTNLIEQFVGDEAYSFVFFGQSGTLDHALSSPSLTAQVTGVTEWHINADEPNVLDYNLEFKSDAQIALYEPDPYRSSDHDPVIVGLQLKDSKPRLTVYGSPDDDSFDSVFPDEKGFIGNQQILFTGSGNDAVDVTFAYGNNRVDLGSGNDTLYAGSNNRILAGSGDDLLFFGSGDGNNVITGGAGQDQFWLVTDTVDLPTQSNIITDFMMGSDAIGFASTILTFDQLTLTQSGANTILNTLGQNLAILQNIQAANLSVSDFAFA